MTRGLVLLIVALWVIGYAQGKCVVLTLQNAQDALKDGSILHFCGPGTVKENRGTGCLDVEGDGETMPFYTNCSFPLRCTKECYPRNHVQVDMPCSPTHDQTCKCTNPDWALSEEGTECIEPPIQTTPPPDVSTSVPLTTHVKQDVSECSSDPCKHDGTCTDLVDGFTCQCAAGWKGATCQEHIACKSSPCLNRGLCLPFGENYMCNCTSEFSGNYCEHECVVNTVSVWDVIWPAVFAIAVTCLGVGFLLGIFCWIKKLRHMRRMPKVWKWKDFCRLLFNSAANPYLHTAANPDRADEEYCIRRPFVAIIYDERRQHVKEDLKHADKFIKKLLGNQPIAEVKIKSTSAEHVQNKMKAISQADFRQIDIFLCIVLCHGDKLGICCNTPFGEPTSHVSENDMIQMFKGDKCKGLLNKPKVFLFNQCRGDSETEPVYRAGPGDGNGRGNDERPSLTPMTDFLIVYSCLPLCQAFFTRHGSWLMQDLLEAIRQKPQYDLVSLLTMMIRAVTHRIGQYGKQQPIVLTTLRKRIYLNGAKPTQATQDSGVENGDDDDDDDGEDTRSIQVTGADEGMLAANPNSQGSIRLKTPV